MRGPCFSCLSERTNRRMFESASRKGSKGAARVKATMKHTTSSAFAIRSAYHWSAFPSRGLKRAVIEPFAGFPGGVGLAWSFRVASAARPGSVRVSLNGLAPTGGGWIGLHSAFQYARYCAATCGLRTRWPTLEWPKMPPFEMLVEPVQTSIGWPFLSSTMNLLCFWAPPDLRGAQTLDRPTWLIIFRLRSPLLGSS